MASRNTTRDRSRRGRQAAPSTTPARTEIRPVVLAGLLVVMAMWAYSTSFRGVFIYDDRVAIVENPNVRSLWPLTSAMSAPAETPVSARPIASLTLAINYALAPADARDTMAPGGASDPPGATDRFLRNVWGYHAMNVALHVLAALALAGVVRRTWLAEPLRASFGGAATWLGFATAAIWVIHPLTTDAVTYVAQRTEVLMGLCYALTLYCSIRAAEKPHGVAARWWIVGAVVACVAGMGSKQTMVSAPVAVWAWDWLFLPTTGGRRRSRWPLYAGLSATWLVLAALVAYERWPTSIGFALEGWTPWTYLLTQTTVIAHYARLAVAGGPLAVDYDGWPMSRSVLVVWPYAVPLLVLLALTVAGLARRRPWAFPAVVWFAALAPSSSVLPLATEIAAERRMYVPLASLVALAVAGGYVMGRAVIARLAEDDRRRRVFGRLMAALAVATLAGAYGSMTYARNRDFWSADRIWGDTVEKRPANPRARVNYAATLVQSRRLFDAERQLREAVRLRETSAPAQLNLGSVLCQLGRLDECVAHLERALALDEKYTAVYHNLGEAYGALGNRALSAKYFALAVEAAPTDPFLLNRLGWILATAPEDTVRDGIRAVAVGERAVQLTRRADATSLDTLAAAYAEVGRFEDAERLAREAIAAAGRGGPRELLPELMVRLSRYEARQKYREPGR